MPLITASFFSSALLHDVTVEVIIPSLSAPDGPEGYSAPKIYPAGTKFQTLYLLHGIFGDRRSWLAGSLIERYATEHNIAVVMPSGDLSFYTDMDCGGGVAYNYGKFVGEELVNVTRLLFPLSDKREDTFIAGLSMGGYGALKLGLEYFDTFSAIGALSAVIDVVGSMEAIEKGEATALNGLERLQQMVFGSAEKARNTVCDIHYMAQKRLDEGRLPFICQTCGTEDFLYTDNLRFKDLMKFKLDLDESKYVFYDAPGTHDWKFWDENICKVIETFPLKRSVITE